MARIIQFRRDSASNWTSANPTLAESELGYETDTKLFKIGDGSTAWTSLAYFDSVSQLYDTTITSIADNDVLVYEASSSKWKNQQFAIGDYLPVSTPASGDAIRRSDGTSLLSESSNVATLDNVQLGSNVTGVGGTATQYFELNLSTDSTQLIKTVASASDTVTFDNSKNYHIGSSMDFEIKQNNLVMVI